MNNLTLHIVNDIPWANLNRDDTGTPKRTIQGGVLRGLLSSQSIKRAIRTDYENRSLNDGIEDSSTRSTHLADLVATRAQQINGDLNDKTAQKLAKKLIGTLTKADSGSSENEKGRTCWLSNEEIEAAAEAVAHNEDSGLFIREGMTGSLAIAAFGRMFANAVKYNTEAAISVSPAISTHAAMIENDYFSTVDDAQVEESGAGSSYLGAASYTSGVFYRTITIDREQLHRSWTGITSDHARKQLEQFVTSLLYKLPRGKVKGTAPFTMPVLILAEEQNYRMAYDFEQPVSAAENGGYRDETIKALAKQRKLALAFDASNFGKAWLAGMFDSNEFEDLKDIAFVNKDGLVEAVVDWIL